MKILLDECLDWRLSRDIPGHDVKTVRQMGWAGIKNGELLALASLDFEAFVTVDINLISQQDVSAFSIAVIILRAKTNRLSDVRRLVPSLLEAIESAERGKFHFVGD